jgi:hypothetical protein
MEQLKALIEKIDRELAKQEREKREWIVAEQLQRQYRDETLSTIVDGREYVASLSFTEASMKAQEEVETMSDEQLEAKFDEVYDDWSAYASSEAWEALDEYAGREQGLNETKTWAQELIDYGIHAFDPDHPRFKQDPAP